MRVSTQRCLSNGRMEKLLATARSSTWGGGWDSDAGFALLALTSSTPCIGHHRKNYSVAAYAFLIALIGVAIGLNAPQAKAVSFVDSPLLPDMRFSTYSSARVHVPVITETADLTGKTPIFRMLAITRSRQVVSGRILYRTHPLSNLMPKNTP